MAGTALHYVRGHRMRRALILALLLSATPALAQEKKTREQKVRDDKAKVEADGFWMYNDLPGAFAKAKETGKPIVVVLRCIPCEECVKLDDDLVDTDPVVRPLLEQFVCVRVVGTNGLDLKTFQFDTDQSFAVFFLNADGTIYGRFGTRSHHSEWIGDVSIAGLAKALQGALDLHKDYPNNKAGLASKRGPEPEVPSPEQYPSLKDEYTSALNYEGNVVQSCIHCHQIGDAQREFYRSQGKPIPDRVLFPTPHPKTIGLTLDPKEMATVLAVEPGSAGARVGIEAGDRIRALGGQLLISIADVQWVLHRLPAEEVTVVAEVVRGGKVNKVPLKLNAGWKRAGDLSWRVSSWGLRRMVTGGLLLKEATDAERSAARIAPGAMALRVEHVGEYGEHAAAKNAGFLKGDILTSYDGRTDLLRDSDLLAYGVNAHKPGETVAVKVLRDGKVLEMSLPIQK